MSGRPDKTFRVLSLYGDGIRGMFAASLSASFENDFGEPLAGYFDLIVQYDSAVLQIGDDVLKKIAVETALNIQRSVTIDWWLKESVRATMRSRVRRVLAGYDYPPNHEEKAVDRVLQQMELLAGEGTGK